MSKINYYHILYLFLIIAFQLSGCNSSHESAPQLSITIFVDNTVHEITIQKGKNVKDALDLASITLDPLDITTPPLYSSLLKDTDIGITRVRETIDVRLDVIPFDRHELPNESMVLGEIRLLQAGKNGLLEKTYLHVLHDDVEISKSIVSEILLEVPEPEIVMVGVPSPLSNFSLEGTLVYLNSGNAWLIESSTANRRPIITTGDLDGRVFSLSPDGQWLLFSRKSSKPLDEEINTLWITKVGTTVPILIDIHVSNVIHFAEWQPGENFTIAYSTVEPRLTAPGWQANNDLYLLSFDLESMEPETPEEIIASSSGGIYGWWGTTFKWSPDGANLAFARPDGIGLVDFVHNDYTHLINITPLKTFSDWAWVPGLTWSSESETIYYVDHSPPSSLISPEESPVFDLVAYSLSSGNSSTIRRQVGMFAYPIASPVIEITKYNVAQVSFLQSIFPTQSGTSRYRQYIMDNDGSEQELIFPDETLIGITAQSNWGVWSTVPDSPLFAILYEGNIWIIDMLSGSSRQVTSDGLTDRVDWK